MLFRRVIQSNCVWPFTFQKHTRHTLYYRENSHNNPVYFQPDVGFNPRVWTRKPFDIVQHLI